MIWILVLVLALVACDPAAKQAEPTATVANPPQVTEETPMRGALLAELVDQGIITEEQATAFEEIHQRLVEAGLLE